MNPATEQEYQKVMKISEPLLKDILLPTMRPKVEQITRAVAMAISSRKDIEYLTRIDILMDEKLDLKDDVIKALVGQGEALEDATQVLKMGVETNERIKALEKCLQFGLDEAMHGIGVDKWLKMAKELLPEEEKVRP